MKGVSESLAGRVGVFELEGLSQEEIAADDLFNFRERSYRNYSPFMEQIE
jgi:hypothetical protein